MDGHKFELQGKFLEIAKALTVPIQVLDNPGPGRVATERYVCQTPSIPGFVIAPVKSVPAGTVIPGYGTIQSEGRNMITAFVSENIPSGRVIWQK